MMNMTRALRLSASCLVLMTGAASAYSVPGDIPPLSLLKLNTHTQTLNLSADSMLKNQSSLSSAGTPRQLAAGIMLEQRAPGQYPSAANRWLTASVCFITDTNDCSGNTFGDGEGYPNKPNPIDPIQPVPDEDKCSELGFKKTSCSEGYSPSGFCSYNSAYFKECVCSEACPDGYQDYPCGSGMLQADTVTPNCKTCYKCTACEDECPSGHTTENGTCRQASSYVTECGNKCYKVLDNSCKSGQLSAPAESGGYRNKIVSYTDCGNPCFQSYNDNCDTGYVKTKESGKCYETTAKYTDYGTACYKEKACCDDTCSGYKQNTAPTTTQCPYGYNSSTTGCGNKCYTCKPCNNCNGYNETSSSTCAYGADSCYNQCLGKTMYQCRACVPNRCYPALCQTQAEGGDSYYNASECARLYNKTTATDNCGNSYNLYTNKAQCFSSVSTMEELYSNSQAGSCTFSLTKNIVSTSYSHPGNRFCKHTQITDWNVNLNGHTMDGRILGGPRNASLTLKNGTVKYIGQWADFSDISFNNVSADIGEAFLTGTGFAACLKSASFTNATINIEKGDYIFTTQCSKYNATINISGYLKVNTKGFFTTRTDAKYAVNFGSGAYICSKGTKYIPKKSTITEQDGGNLLFSDTSLFTPSGGC